MAAEAFGDNPIGIIQGRLTAAGGQLQCFPHGKWREEFFVARDAGFDCIELIVERKKGASNPIWEQEGVEALKRAVSESGVKTLSLCDDEIMDAALLSDTESERAEALADIKTLIGNMGAVGIGTFVMPLLEGASLRENGKGFVRARQALETLVPFAEGKGVHIMLEHDLPTPRLRELIAGMEEKVGVCYDTGNRKSMGFDPAAEILELGDLIRHVHIKDKDAEGHNVMLGTGLVDFPAVFRALHSIGYGGPLILETYRGEDDVREGRENLAFVRGLLP